MPVLSDIEGKAGIQSIITMKSNPLVSVIIPTRNSAQFLDACLTSIKNQTYKNIEIIVVDNNSTDATKEIAKKYSSQLIDVSALQSFEGRFSATFQRNFGVKKSKGEIVYYFDADMAMEQHVIKECVELIWSKGAGAVIIPEDSHGTTFWARCKQFERRCYWGDDSIEAPRCFLKKIWNEGGGLDESIAGGGDDWDMHEKMKDMKITIKRTKALVLHNEGALTLKKLIKKRFLYGKDTIKYIKKRKNTALIQYFPIRKGFLKNWKMFIKSPILGMGTIIMRLVEYIAGGAGILYNIINKNE